VTTKITAIAIEKPYPEINPKLKLKRKQLKQWTGRYEFEDGVIRNVSYRRGHLYSQREGGDSFKLIPASSKIFYLESSILRLEFSSMAEQTNVLFKGRMKHSNGIKAK